jgi:glycosyltransferase involved in cell wall biosynthesis
MLGRVDDEALRDLYRRAQALLHPQQEDFGIIAVEAQACGCPVIAYASGGALETVTQGTGIFFDKQTSMLLCDAIREFENCSIDPRACRANAERYSAERFDKAIAARVKSLLSR